MTNARDLKNKSDACIAVCATILASVFAQEARTVAAHDSTNFVGRPSQRTAANELPPCSLL